MSHLLLYPTNTLGLITKGSEKEVAVLVSAMKFPEEAALLRLKKKMDYLPLNVKIFSFSHFPIKWVKQDSQLVNCPITFFWYIWYCVANGKETQVCLCPVPHLPVPLSCPHEHLGRAMCVRQLLLKTAALGGLQPHLCSAALKHGGTCFGAKPWRSPHRLMRVSFAD